MERASDNEQICLAATFEGNVQGVGFRMTVADIAGRSGVSGFVKNKWDGTVYMVAEGTRSDLEALMSAIYRSRLGRHIRQAHTSWSGATGAYAQFRIRYD